MSVTAFPLERRMSVEEHLRRAAIERRARLWTPPNGRKSDEIEVLSESTWRKIPRQHATYRLPASIDPKWAVFHHCPQAEINGELQYIPSAFSGYVVQDEEEEKEPPLIDGETKWPVTVRDIARAASRVFDVSMIDLVSARRTTRIVLPRQIAMYLAREMTPASLPQIGRLFGNKDHTTVLHGWQKIKAMIGDDEITAGQVLAVREAALIGRRRMTEQPVTG